VRRSPTALRRHAMVSGELRKRSSQPSPAATVTPAGPPGRERPVRRQPGGHAGGDEDQDSPGQAVGPGGELRGSSALVLGVGGGARLADTGPDPHRHHRRRPTGPGDVVLVVVVVVGEQGGQVGLAEGPDRYPRLLVVTGGPEAVRVKGRLPGHGWPRRSSHEPGQGRTARARDPRPAARSRGPPGAAGRSPPGRPPGRPRSGRPRSPRRPPGPGVSGTRSTEPPLCSTTAVWARRSSATTSEPEPSGAGSGVVSQPRAVSRSAACCNCGSGGASRTASLPSTWVWACSVSQVAAHRSYDTAGQPWVMARPRRRRAGSG
jgi:hypothetical protein